MITTTGVAVTGGIGRSLVEVLGTLDPTVAALVVAALVLMIVVPPLLAAISHWSTTRRLAKRITSEKGALRALEMLQPAPPRRGQRTRPPRA